MNLANGQFDLKQAVGRGEKNSWNWTDICLDVYVQHLLLSAPRVNQADL